MIRDLALSVLSLCHLGVWLSPPGPRWLLQLHVSRPRCSQEGEKDQHTPPPFTSHWPEPGHTASSSCGGAGFTVLIQASHMPGNRRHSLTVVFNLHFPCGRRAGMLTPGAPRQESQLAGASTSQGSPEPRHSPPPRDRGGLRAFGGDPTAGPQDSSSAVPKASTPNSGQCLTTPSETHFFTGGSFYHANACCFDPRMPWVFFWKYLVCNILCCPDWA